MALLAAPLSSPAFFTPASFGLEKSTDDLVASAGRLTSGNRILKIGDDVASFTIAARLQSQVAVFKQASKNAAAADSLLQVAGGGLDEIDGLLDKLHALAVQADTASLSANERSFLQQQFTEYLNEIDAVAAGTSFNGTNLLDGSFSEDFHVGADPSDVIGVSIDGVATGDIFSGGVPDIASQAHAADAQDAIDDAAVLVGTLISTAGALQKRFQIAEDNIRVLSAGATNARSALADTDIPEESIDFTLTRLRLDVAASAIAQAHNLQSGLLEVLRFSSPRNS